MRLADYVIEYLVSKGLKDIFLVTGRGILFLTDAVAKNDKIRHYSLHHEQSCSYAAIANSIINDNVGCCLVSTGCASTNAITGVLNAWQDKVPVIFISGNNPLDETTYYHDIGIRTFGSQETNIIPIVKPITKYATMITNANDIAYELEKAYYIANEGDKGPVWIDIPLDIQNARVEENELKHYIPNENVNISFDGNKVENIIKEIKNSKRPIFIVGSGVKNSNSIDEFTKIINKTKIPFVYTPSAVDNFDSNITENIGCVSSLGGSREGNFAVQNSDLIIVLGSRMPSIVTGGAYDEFGKCAKKIIVTLDENELKKNNIKYDHTLKSDINSFLKYLLENIDYITDDNWINKCIHWKEKLSLCNSKYLEADKVDLYNLAKEISNNLDDKMCIVTDAGFEELILPSNIRFVRGSRCVHPISQGSMGFSLPASIGVDVDNKYNVICVNGDGSIMMNLQELQSIKTHGLKIKIIIANNNNYAVIRKRQEDLFRTRTIGTDISNGVETPNWEKVASCYDYKYIKINNNKELKDKLKLVLNETETIICEIMCDEKQKYLHTSLMKTSNNKIVRRPMEDQSPFLDREIIKSELLIPYKE